MRVRSLSAILFLALAGWVSEARSQSPPGSAESIGRPLTADEIRRALQGLPAGANLPDLPPDLLNLLKDRLHQDAKQPVDDQRLKQAMERFKDDPKFREQVENLTRNLKQNNGKLEFNPQNKQDFDDLRKKLGQAMPKFDGNAPPNGDPKVDPKNIAPPPIGQPPNVQPPVVPPFERKDPLKGLDPSGRNPLDKPSSPNEKAAQAAAGLWERNIGPLDETPAVKRALFELIEGTEDLRDADGKSFWEELGKEEGDATSLSDLLDGASFADSWTLPKFELGEWKLFGDDGPDVNNGGGDGRPPRESWWSRNFGRRTPSSSSPSGPRAPGSGGGWNIGLPSVEGGWLPIVILAGILVGGLLVWRLWGVKWSRARAVAGLYGPGWPIDPRRIHTREHVVIAFEYLSVLICGPSAMTWTHNTIAGALADLAKTHGEVAGMLARLYELARYAPLDEPLTTTELAEARRLVCALAGLESE